MLWRGSATCRSFSCYCGLSKGWHTSNCKEIDLKLYLLTASILFLKVSGDKYRFCTKVRVNSRLASQHYVWAKYKEEVPDVSGSRQNIETPCNTKLTLTELKSLRSERTEKLAKTNVCSCNTKTLKFQRRRYNFRLWVFASNSECFYCWHWRVLPKVLEATNILVHLTGAFQNKVHLVLCIIGYD